MKLVSYNIQYGFGQDGRYDLARAASALDGVDIVALQEVERHWPRSNSDDQPALLGAMLPDFHTIYGPAFDMDADLRDHAGRPLHRRRQFGTMILSRWPILWSRLHLLPMRRMVRPLNTQNAALEAVIAAPSGPLRVWSIHLAHVGVEERLEQIEFLLALHRDAPARGGPWSGTDDEPARGWTAGEPEPPCPADAIWMGDFNCEPDSAEHARIVGQNPYHSGALYDGGFADAATLFKTPHGFSHLRADGVRRRLDYCFVSGGLAHAARRHWVDEAETASDHLPVWTELEL